MRLIHVLFVALWWCVTALHAQPWSALNGLHAGDRIRVLEDGGQQVSGAFRTVSADALALTTAQGEQSIERRRIRRVQVRSGERRVRNLLIGAALGAAVGVAVDQGLGQYLRNETGESGATRAVSYIAPIGLFAGIAGAFPAYRTVFRAP